MFIVSENSYFSNKLTSLKNLLIINYKNWLLANHNQRSVTCLMNCDL